MKYQNVEISKKESEVIKFLQMDQTILSRHILIIPEESSE